MPRMYVNRLALLTFALIIADPFNMQSVVLYPRSLVSVLTMKPSALEACIMAWHTIFVSDQI
jgi:hypothetical protein